MDSPWAFLHCIWDFVIPYFSQVIPKGYDLLCITADILIAIYFFNSFKKEELILTHYLL